MKYIFRKTCLALAITTGIGTAVGPTQAAEGTLKATITSEKEVTELNDRGEVIKRRVLLEVAVPGDEVIYTVSVANTGAEPADDVVVIDPVPEAMAYVEGSAFGPAGGMVATYSADGGVTYLPRGNLIVQIDSGQVRMAAPGDITHIRWQLSSPIAPGAKVDVGYRATVK